MAIQANRERLMADSVAVVAHQNEMEARRQMHIALVQSDSATHARNRALLSARGAEMQRERALKAEKELERIKSVPK